jgi:endonuclease VIII
MFHCGTGRTGRTDRTGRTGRTGGPFGRRARAVAEGDTLARIATVLGETLVGQRVEAAQARPGSAALDRVSGTTIESVEARGKHLLIGFDNGLTLHTHLGLHGSWHRYRPGEAWRRPRARAAAILQTPRTVAVAFDAPTVELLDTRALDLHPRLRRLGPDASAADFDFEATLASLRAPANAERAIGDALLDQRIVAGLGNVYRSEVCFIERVDPFAPVGSLEDRTLRRLLETGARLLRANRDGGARVTTALGTPGNLYAYGRTRRPCRRCGTLIVSRLAGANRRAYWCPRCQPSAG